MYNPVNLSVSPSLVLTQSLYAIHIGFILAYLLMFLMSFHWALLPALCLLLLVQGFYFRKLWRRELIFLQPRQWQFFNGQARLKQSHDWVSVDVLVQQVWPSCVMLKYKANSKSQAPNKWHRDIIMYDACEAESFRQLIALMRTEYQGKEV